MRKKLIKFLSVVLASVILFCSMPIQGQCASGDTTVYITNTGSKYHCSGCRYLSKSSHAISLSSAVNNGYEPCSVCNPPTITYETEQKETVKKSEVSYPPVSSSDKENPCYNLDTFAYASLYPDLYNAYGYDVKSLMNHWVNSGAKESRYPNIMGSTDYRNTVFDPTYYANTYPDVVSSIGTDADELYHHYVLKGFYEGRLPCANSAENMKIAMNTLIYAATNH